MYPKSLENLIENFKMLPGVGAKTAERYALLMLEKNETEIQGFAQNLIDCKAKIKTCEICGNIAEEEHCSICEDSTRNTKIICVVQSAKDIIAMEKTREFRGVYHVLNGVISPRKGILPEDLTISKLIDRLDQGVEEVIIATNLTLEGETTALYLAKLLEDRNIYTTRIAHGLPMGGHLDYADELTLIKALEGRKSMKND
ncbi:Recombination protein RecR [bioreactor metagenome]|uniref:Recombination protein RecR n=1 Tax=bioreactor metagenome TaxID=1076179 RepID=A0A645EZC9_9ZZZZ